MGTVKDYLHQILCFERVQAKVALGTVAVIDEATSQRPAVIRYVKTLSTRLDARQRRLHLLDFKFPQLTPPRGHLSGSFLSTTFGWLQKAIMQLKGCWYC